MPGLQHWNKLQTTLIRLSLRMRSIAINLLLITVFVAAIGSFWAIPTLATPDQDQPMVVPLLSGRDFADVDGDGDIDVVLPLGDINVVTQDDSNKDVEWLWLNDGSDSFSPVQGLVGRGTRVSYMAFGDLNQDGFPDLVSSNRDLPNYVWLNDGSGTMVLTQGDLGDSDARAVAIGDLDGDGDLDLVFANANDNGNDVFFNDGSGHFGEGQRIGHSSHFVALGDLDRDGDLDAIFAPLVGEGVEVFFNDGLGNFKLDLYPDKVYSRRVALGDLDRDGDLDVVFANGLGATNYVWFNDGTGKFTLSQSLGEDDSIDVKVGDLDGDGDLDIVFANRLGLGNSIWFNDGSGKFFETITFGKLLLDDNVRNLQVRDVDGDGDLDAAFGYAGISVWFNQTSQGMPGTGVYQPADNLVENEAVVGQKSQTVIQIGDRHILTAYSEGGDLPARPFPFQFRIEQLGIGTSADVKLGDLNGDGTLDVVFAHYFGEQSQVWFNDGQGKFTLNQLLSPGSSFSVELGDLNGDGALDIVLPKRGLNNEIWLNDGQGDLTLTQSLEIIGNDTRSTALGDLDGDGDLDIVFGNAFGEKISLWRNDGAGFFTPMAQSFGDVFSRIDRVALGDFDRDDDLDLVFVNAFEEGNEVWFNDGGGHFSLAQAEIGAASSRNIVVGDLDLDGDLDLIFANISGDRNQVWFNDGTGHFTLHEVINSSTKAIDLGDWDNDGDLDVFLGQSSGKNGNAIWLNDGTGHFTQLAAILEVSSHAVALGDLNGDGLLDAAVANIGQATNVVVFNNPNFGFPEYDRSRSADYSSAP